MTAGRPPFYKTPEEMQIKIDEYFVYCEESERIPLLGEIAYWLGFESRQSLWDYLQKDDFSYTIRRIKQKCENELNQMALLGKANPQIAKLNLMTNYDFKEKSETDNNIKSEQINIIIESAKSEDKNS